MDCCDTNDEDSHWTRIDTEFNKIGGQIQQAECVFGFRDRVQMIQFATNILEDKMPSISRLAAVRYSIRSANGPLHDQRRWYQASLDSEYLTGTTLVLPVPRHHTDQYATGTPKEKLAEVYP